MINKVIKKMEEEGMLKGNENGKKEIYGNEKKA